MDSEDDSDEIQIREYPLEVQLDMDLDNDLDGQGEIFPEERKEETELLRYDDDMEELRGYYIFKYPIYWTKKFFRFLKGTASGMCRRKKRSRYPRREHTDSDIEEDTSFEIEIE